MCVQLLIRSRPILWMSKLRARERKQLTWHTQCETVQPGASYLIIHSPNKFPFIHNIYWHLCNTPFGLPAVKKSACQCRRLRRLGFNPCVGKIPWRRKWQPTAILFFFFFTAILVWEIQWLEEPGGLQSVVAKSWTRLSD